MGKKGTPHRKWSKEEKLQYIRLHLEGTYLAYGNRAKIRSEK